MKNKLTTRLVLMLTLVLLLALTSLAAAQEPQPNNPPPGTLPVERQSSISRVRSMKPSAVRSLISLETSGVAPASVSAVMEVGTSVFVEKTVTLPEFPPKLDLVLMVDLSGSYNDDLPNIKLKAPEIFTDVRNEVADSQFGLTTFVDYPFAPWGDSSTGDYAFRLDQDLTADQTTWLTAVNAMSTRYGGDGPESQYVALYQAATGAGQTVGGYTIPAGQDPSWRDKVTHVIAITTDAEFHDAGDGGGPFPYPGPTFVDTVAALTDKNIKVIAIKAPGATTQMDDIAGATGGAVTTTSNTSEEIVEAILAALEELTFTVTPFPVGCEPLQLTFDPASHTDVAGGESVTFEETIAVPTDATPGEYSCQVEFYADETLIGTESISIVVFDPNAGFVTGGGWIDSPEGALVRYTECGGLTALNAVRPAAQQLNADKAGLNAATLNALQVVPIEYTTINGCVPYTDGDGLQGETTLHNISTPDTWEFYRFYGIAGLTIDIEAHRTTSAMDPAMQLCFGTAADTTGLGFFGGCGPEMTAVDWADDNNGIPHGVGGMFEDPKISTTLPHTGWYSLMVFDYIGAGPGPTVPFELHYTLPGVELQTLPDVELLTGKATFGFVSKYKKGDEVPTGNTEFQFHEGDLNFHSSSYEWLVVTGSDYAIFEGTGTINGALAPNDERYKFKIWAGDDDPDTFRIKIWYEVGDTKTVVYDNGFDQPLGSGSIIIHTRR